MFDHMCRILPLLLLGEFFLTGVQDVTGIEIRTEKEMEAVNGTDVKLSCTFSSTHPVTPRSVIVSWNFQPLNSKPGESLFYYQDETPHPPTSPQFKGHVVWSGDIMRKDASITLKNVNPTFNGTYSCHVKNPPDVLGNIGEINLRVVNKVSLSEISLLAIVVGGACGIILLILTIFVAVKFYKKRRRENDIELHEHDFKDSTVCKPEEAVHLTGLKEKKEVSSDDEESEPSSGDDDDNDDDDDDDDDDD